MKSARAIMMTTGVILSLAWIATLSWVLNLVPLRSAYIQLWNEYDHLRELLDQGQKVAMNASGNSLFDLFEYMSMAQTEYLSALEAVLVLGVIPTMLLWAIFIAVGIRYVDRSDFEQSGTRRKFFAANATLESRE